MISLITTGPTSGTGLVAPRLRAVRAVNRSRPWLFTTRPQLLRFDPSTEPILRYALMGAGEADKFNEAELKQLRLHGMASALEDSLTALSQKARTKAAQKRARALARTLEIADRCNLHLGKEAYVFPHFAVPEGETPDSFFARVARQAGTHAASRPENASSSVIMPLETRTVRRRPKRSAILPKGTSAMAAATR